MKEPEYNNNKIEFLSRQLRPLHDSVVDWALDKALPHVALRRRNGLTTCVACGNTMSYHGPAEPVVCRGCGATLNVINVDEIKSSKLTYNIIFNVFERVEDYCVVRTFKMNCRLLLSTKFESYINREICRHWFSPDGEVTVCSLPIVMGYFIGFGKMKSRESSRLLCDYYADIAEVYPIRPDFSDIDSPLADAITNLPNWSSVSAIYQCFDNRRDSVVAPAVIRTESE